VVEGACVSIADDRRFTFDMAFGPESTQEQMFESGVSELVDGCLEGYNATVLAYGQTGSGKTYTMGMDGVKDGVKGLVPRVCDYLFSSITDRKEVTVKMTYVEVYNENVRDLLNKENHSLSLAIRETKSGVTVQGATQVLVKNVQEIMEQVNVGAAIRSVGFTNMNAKSSRSHAILTLSIEKHLRNGNIRKAKLHLVDLAGSERNKRTQAVGARFQESIQINQGLLALGNVISVLGGRQHVSHVPYRQSKLTRLLQDSLGGNSCTLFIACVSTADDDIFETINTLKYANRARNIQNAALINEEIGPPLRDTLQDSLLNLFSTCDEMATNKNSKLVKGLQEIFDALGFSILNKFPECHCGKLKASLMEANANLQRDEIIFANKMEELQECRNQLEKIKADRDHWKLMKYAVSPLRGNHDSVSTIEGNLHLISPIEGNLHLISPIEGNQDAWRSCSLDESGSYFSPQQDVSGLKTEIVELQNALAAANEKIAQIEVSRVRLQDKNKVLFSKMKRGEEELVLVKQEFSEMQKEAARLHKQAKCRPADNNRVAQLLDSCISKGINDWKHGSEPNSLDKTMDLATAKTLINKESENHMLEEIFLNKDFRANELARKLEKMLVPQLEFLSMEEKDMALTVLCGRLATLETEKSKYKFLRAHLKLKVQDDQHIIEELQTQVQKLHQEIQDLSTTISKPSLDEQYIISLEKDINFYKSSVLQLEKKAGRANIYKGELAAIKQEYGNLRSHLDNRPRESEKPVMMKINKSKLKEIVLVGENQNYEKAMQKAVSK